MAPGAWKPWNRRGSGSRRPLSALDRRGPFCHKSKRIYSDVFRFPTRRAFSCDERPLDRTRRLYAGIRSNLGCLQEVPPCDHRGSHSDRPFRFRCLGDQPGGAEDNPSDRAAEDERGCGPGQPDPEGHGFPGRLRSKMKSYPVQNLPRRALGQAPPPDALAPPPPAVPPCCRVYWGQGGWKMACSGGGQTYEGPATQEMIGVWSSCVVGQAPEPPPPPPPPPPVGPNPAQQITPLPDGSIPPSEPVQQPPPPPPRGPNPAQQITPSPGFQSPLPQGVPDGSLPIPTSPMPVPGAPRQLPLPPVFPNPSSLPQAPGACPLGPVPLAKWVEQCPGFRRIVRNA